MQIEFIDLGNDTFVQKQSIIAVVPYTSSIRSMLEATEKDPETTIKQVHIITPGLNGRPPIKSVVFTDTDYIFLLSYELKDVHTLLNTSGNSTKGNSPS